MESGLEMGTDEEEDRPELGAQTRSPPVLQAPRTPVPVRAACLQAGQIGSAGPDGRRAASPPPAEAPPPP